MNFEIVGEMTKIEPIASGVPDRERLRVKFWFFLNRFDNKPAWRGA